MYIILKPNSPRKTEKQSFQLKEKLYKCNDYTNQNNLHLTLKCNNHLFRRKALLKATIFIRSKK